MVDLGSPDKEGLVGNMKLRDSLGYSVHEMVEFENPGAARRSHSKLTTLEFRRADFSLFLVEYKGIEPWREGVPKRAG